MTNRLVLTAPEPAELVVDDHVYVVRIGADLDVEVMAELIEISQEYRRYGNKPERLPDWIRRAKRLVTRIVENGHPDEDDLAYFHSRAFSPSELLQILTLCSGNPGGAQAEVVAALSDGVPEGEGEPMTDPTNSRPRSRGRRSRSARRSGSPQATGEDSDGATSVSISGSGIAS